MATSSQMRVAIPCFGFKKERLRHNQLQDKSYFMRYRLVQNVVTGFWILSLDNLKSLPYDTCAKTFNCFNLVTGWQYCTRKSAS